MVNLIFDTYYKVMVIIILSMVNTSWRNTVRKIVHKIHTIK